MNKKLLALYGLKWNPFAPDVPVEALHLSRRIEAFCGRVQQLVGEGGFALVTGAPGTGQSVALRILAERLGAQRDIKIGIVSRPQAGLADFYREMGELFGVDPLAAGSLQCTEQLVATRRIYLILGHSHSCKPSI